MLKLTHRFCRYTRLTCENIKFRQPVKIYSALRCGRNICATLCVEHSIADKLTHTCPQVTLLGSIKKCLRPRRLQNSFSCCAASTTGKMNESHLLPSVSYVHHGESIEVDDEGSMQFDFANASTYSSRSKKKEKIPPDFRRWERVNKKGTGTPFRFTVASYNVLAQGLLECHPYLYTDCNPEDLPWHVRSEKIMTEITDLNPDIICLQEVQATHIKTFYIKFEELGYYGIFKCKTNRRQDGCAIYYKKHLFEIIDCLTVEYCQPDMPILSRDNVGLLVKLRPRGLAVGPVVVATTHLLYNPKRADVRLAQMQVLLAELDRFAYFEGATGSDECYHPIVLTGDFNSPPQSPPIKLLDCGKVSTISLRKDVDWRRLAITDNCQHLAVHVNRPAGIFADYSMIELQNTDVTRYLSRANCAPRRPRPEAVTASATSLRHSALFNTPWLRHPFHLESVYSRVKQNRSQEATTFQNGWITVDYMYYSYSNKLQLLKRLRLPTRRECEVLHRLPNNVYGSDHLMLAAHFELHPKTIPQ